jgi:hypothetical protein
VPVLQNDGSIKHILQSKLTKEQEQGVVQYGSARAAKRQRLANSLKQHRKGMKVHRRRFMDRSTQSDISGSARVKAARATGSPKQA